ncbi:hypothetical protein [Helicobacter trogontum]|uniref:Lipoprotein n=1 Tax=Helicobacter trogontum TaxID=50960 RepID=A0A4U8S4F1_9HELI|nr:hypothetical protein [Helicobacter trogontum]TLD80641.1 hypothetical protein LS81_009335 [Helicobacter trogontum]
MNIIKKYFTLRKIIIFLAVVFVVLFFVGGCSFTYMDWQYYVARDMCKNESGYYIYDEKLYKETEKTNYNAHLSNGYRLQLRSGYGLYENEKIIPTKYSRIIQYINYEYFYIDNNGKKNLIYQGIDIGYHNYGLWLSGDEGAGFGLNEHKILTCGFNTHFILKDNKWQPIKK